LKRLFLAFLLLTIPLNAREYRNGYLDFIRHSSVFCRYWNPGMTEAEHISFAATTWRGTGGDSETALIYSAVCANETGFKYLVNVHGAGWSGTKWIAVIKSAQREGYKRPKGGWRMWLSQSHSHSNLFGSRWFCRIRDLNTDCQGVVDWEETVKVWHRGDDRGEKAEMDADKYYKQILMILGRMATLEPPIQN